jgi:hypothetical protein
VVERVERQIAVDLEAEAAVVEVVDDLNPSEGGSQRSVTSRPFWLR